MMTGAGINALWMMLGWLSMVAAWLLVLFALVLMFKGVVAQGRSCAGSDSLSILKERYARGEIDKKEFSQKKKDLEM